MSTARNVFEERVDYPDNPLPQLPSVAEIGEIIALPPERWHGHCHTVALAIVRAGIVPHARVARGVCKGVPIQHSWIVGPTADGELGDCFAHNAVVIDPTLHCYNPEVTGVYVTHADLDGWHTPRGAGPDILTVGRPAPPAPGAPVIPLNPQAFAEMSELARDFVTTLLGPLDRIGWSQLGNLPVIGWPSDEIVRAMYQTPRLRAVLPIDIVGMLTNLDPRELYLHPDDVDPAVAAHRRDAAG